MHLKGKGGLKFPVRGGKRLLRETEGGEEATCQKATFLQQAIHGTW